MTKRCPICRAKKSSENFYKCSAAKDGLGGYCKQCADAKKVAWNAEHPEKKKAYVQKGRILHGKARYARRKARRELNIEAWRRRYLATYRRNAAKIIARNKLKRQIDMGYRLGRSLSARLVYAFKNTRTKKRPGIALELLGCSMEDFRIYLESKFDSGMTWQNYGRPSNGERTWEIDHIMPCAIFDLTKPDHQKRCFHFSNLQPLWMDANRKKSKTVLIPQMPLI